MADEAEAEEEVEEEVETARRRRSAPVARLAECLAVAQRAWVASSLLGSSTYRGWTCRE